MPESWVYPLLLGIWLAESKVSFFADKSCYKKKKNTTKPNKTRSEGLPLLLELLEAESLLLGPTCVTLQMCHRYVYAWSCTPSTLTLILTFWHGFLACWVITGLYLTLNSVSGPDPDLDLLTYLLGSLLVRPLLCPFVFTFGSQLAFPHGAACPCCSLTGLGSSHGVQPITRVIVLPRLFGGREQTFFFHYIRDTFVLSSFLSQAQQSFETHRREPKPSPDYDYIYLDNKVLGFSEVPSLALCPYVKVPLSGKFQFWSSYSRMSGNSSRNRSLS